LKYNFRHDLRKIKTNIINSVSTVVLVFSSVAGGLPLFFTQKAYAIGPTINISNITELRNAVEHQADGQVWTINAGSPYGLDRFNDITAGGQTGWYLPITASNLTINGVGNPTLFGQEYSANGNWSSQDLIAVFGDNVTINGLTLMPKADPNKTVEVLGNDFTLESTTITPNTEVAPSVYDNITPAADEAFAKQWGGSIYFNHAGNHLLKNVTVNNAGISFRYAPSNTHITFDNVNIINQTNDNFTNGYRYSSEFNDSSNTIVGAPKVSYNIDSTLNNLDSALAGAQNGDTVNVNSDLSTAKQVTVTKALTINGNGNTISPTFSKTDASNNSVIGIQSSGVTLNNLVVNGTGGTNLHGINAYLANGINLNNVTVKNNGHYGLVVNGSNVTVNNFSTSSNGWGGVDVDQGSGVTAPTVLTITGHSTQTESGADVLVDNIYNPNVTVNDPGNQYSYATYGIVGVYKLKLATPTNLTPVDGTYTSNPAFVNTWTNVTDATGYEYRTANTMNGDVLGTIIYSDSNLTQPGRYSTSGSTVTRQNGGAPQGTYYWQVRATGPSGRVSDWSQINKVVVDTTAPSTPALLTPPNNGFETTNDFYFTWSDSADSGAPVKYEFQSDNNGSFASPWDSIASGNSEQNNLTTPQIHSTGAPDGTYYWRVRSLDGAGNISPWTDAWKMTIDTQKPAEPTATLKANGVNVLTNGYTSSNTFTFNLSAAGATRYQLKYWNDITGSSFKINSPWNHTISGTVYPDNFTQGEGTHYFAFSACDAAGNCSAYSTPFVVTYDKTAPVATITAPTSTLLHGNVVVNGTVTDLNPDHYYFVVKNSLGSVVAGPGTVNEATVSSWNWDTTSVANGVYTIDLEARDKAGNKDGGSVATMSVTVNNTTTTPSTPLTVTNAPITVANAGNINGNGTANAGNARSLAATSNTPAVLGATDVKSDATGQVKGASTTVKEVAIVTAKKSSTLFGLGWWWLAVLAAIVGFFLIVLRRSDSDKKA